MAANGDLIERYERGKLAEEHYDRLYPKRCEAREMACRRLAEAERRRADVQGPARRWDAFRGFFTDLEAKLEEADAPGQEQPRSAPRSSGASSSGVEIYPNGRKRIIGTLRCVTAEVSVRVSKGATIDE